MVRIDFRFLDRELNEGQSTTITLHECIQIMNKIAKKNPKIAMKDVWHDVRISILCELLARSVNVSLTKIL